MISKNKISQIRKLHAKKFRDESGLFLVEGYKSVEMLCDSDFAVEEILPRRMRSATTILG